MVIFHSYVTVYQRVNNHLNHHLTPKNTINKHRKHHSRKSTLATLRGASKGPSWSCWYSWAFEQLPSFHFNTLTLMVAVIFPMDQKKHSSFCLSIAESDSVTSQDFLAQISHILFALMCFWVKETALWITDLGHLFCINYFCCWTWNLDTYPCMHSTQSWNIQSRL